MKLNVLITALFACVATTFLAQALTSIRNAELLERQAIALSKAGENIRVAKDLKTRLLVHNRNEFLYALHKDSSRYESNLAERAKIAKLLGAMELVFQGEQEAEDYSVFRKSIEAYLDVQGRLDSAPISPVERYNRASYQVDSALAAVEKLIDAVRARMGKVQAEIAADSSSANRASVALTVLSALVLLAGALAVNSFLSRPAARFMKCLAEYGAGRQGLRAEVRGLWEVREVSRIFNLMADRLDEKRKDQLRFLASIAHDIRNPLSSIALASELLIRKTDGQNRELMEVIAKQAKHLNRLVNDLLEVSRIEAGQMVLKPGEFDLCEVIRDAVSLYQSSLSDLHHFEVKLPDEPLVSFFDSGRISQVLANLLSNAVKYSPNGGIVTVRAGRRDGEIFVSVEDGGVGIEAADLDGIFRPFQRSAATKDVIPGIGLGLSASRRIVEAHGGTLVVASTPGKGSIFTFTLPVRGKSLPESHRPIASASARGEDASASLL